ncbi:6-hydroxymethylpterin diphosphokinase MptE-like protein [Oleiharenicola sp. Vm1]|uniref:6-hydroxymethylpterin diphosphokinase MptE-like protein n=1 Tax=Oleiharenicola sp. Vm1 TaxID=3398393 RepID=UPI0039F48763
MSAGRAAHEPTAPWVQEYPGATTAVVIGALPPAWRDRLAGARAILWCAAEAEIAAGAPATPPDRLHVFRRDEATPAQWRETLLRFVRLDARRLPAVFVAPPSEENAAQRCEPFVAVVLDELREQHRGRVTRQQDGFRWQQHVLANLAPYVRRPLPAEWRGALAGLPAAVCGAGPSLDVSAPRLAAGQEGCVVFAADSALRTLARHGVRVDFAVSIDVAKRPEKCLPETGEWPGRVVLSAVSPPGWVERLPAERTWFVANRQITTDWLAQGGVPAPALAAAENCGVTALELARWLGCAPIFLFGLDLALSGRQRHADAADASIYAQSGFDAAQECPAVPGNWEERVPTHAPGDWRALNARLAAFAPGTVFNVSDRGARLDRAAPVRPEAWIAPAPVAKRARLARLADVPAPEPAAAAARCAELRACGRRMHAALPELRAALAAHGPEAAAAAWRRLLADPAIGRALGGFALKLMPHLLPPAEGDTDFWNGLLDEFAQLAEQLRQLA